jgi:hypothetical protein
MRAISRECIGQQTANSGRSQGRIGFRKADACTAQSCGQVTNPPLPCLQSHLR